MEEEIILTKLNTTHVTLVLGREDVRSFTHVLPICSLVSNSAVAPAAG
jgi:hypothetical protein